MVEFLEYEWNIRNVTTSEISKKELPTNENQALKDLQTLIASDPNLCEENYSEEFLLCFLRVRANNAESALRMITCRHFFQKKHPNVFASLEAKDPCTLLQGGVLPIPLSRQKAWIRAALEEGLPGVLPEKDPRGCYTLLFFPGQWDSSACPLLEGVLHATLLSLETILEENGGKIRQRSKTSSSMHWNRDLNSSQSSAAKVENSGNFSSPAGDCNAIEQLPTTSQGYTKDGNKLKQKETKISQYKCILSPKVVAIVDWSGFTMSRCGTAMSSGIRSFIECLQSCIPVHCEGIHFVSQPWYVEGALKLLRPFLTEKSREKIHVHGNNLSQLHSMVGQRHLPAELGGDGPPFHTLTWADRICKDGKTSEMKKEELE